jgi:hypothetical protein
VATLLQADSSTLVVEKDALGRSFHQAALYAFFTNILIRSAKRLDATAKWTTDA